MGDEQDFIPTYAEFLKTIGEENRLKILFTLSEGAKSVSEIIKTTELSQPLVSFHLKTLRKRGLVESERRKTFVYYNLRDKDLVEELAELSKHLEYYQAEKADFEFQWPPWKNCKFFRG